jgi:hypothetical protein
MINIEPHIWVDLRSELEGKHFVSAALDHANRLIVLASVNELDYRYITSDGFSFAKPKSTVPHDYVIIEANERYTTSYSIRQQHWNYHFAQPLPDDELLLVSARRTKTYPDNASVFTHDGTLKREFTLGEAIEHVQTTASGSIWTSYFDEGMADPIGRSGLSRWDAHGNQQYAMFPTGGMMSCYALNVVSEHEVWVYYYTEFPLVRLVDGRVTGNWQSPLRGAHHFAIWQPYVIFYGSYDDKRLHIFRLGDDEQMTPVGSYEVAQESTWVDARGNKIVTMKDNVFYQIDLAEIMRTL